jgi:carbon monoxide dehydrogenase subunit G
MFGKRIRGSGNITTQTRSAGQFNSVDVSGAIDVYVRQDSASSIKIEGDDNLLELVEVIDDGDILRIHPRNGYNLNPSKDIKVYLSSPNYKKFEASGACKIISENKLTSTENITIDLSGSCDAKLELQVPAISADMSGACSLVLKGQSKDFKVEGSGSTSIKCIELLTENTNVEISGAGDAEVSASVKLDVEVSGAGSVKYKGSPAVNQSISGAGSVKKME